MTITLVQSKQIQPEMQKQIQPEMQKQIGGGFGSLMSDAQLQASFVGALPALAGTIYPQTDATHVTQWAGGAASLLYEDRGEQWGGGMWLFPPITNLAPDPFHFSAGDGWSKTGNTSDAASSVTAPDGVSFMRTLTGTDANYSDVHRSIASTAQPMVYSAWYKWDAINPPTLTFPAFTFGLFSPLVPVLPNVSSSKRVVLLWNSGTTVDIGITPAGSDSSGTAVNLAGGAINLWGFQVIQNDPHDVPLINGSANAAVTLDASHASMVVDSQGSLDFEVTFMPAALTFTETTYLWSATTSEGLMALRVNFLNGTFTYVLTVRGVDVLDTFTTTGTSSGQTNAAQAGQPTTVRAWYSPVSNSAGIRQQTAGLYLPDALTTTTGTGLVAPTTVYLGTNLGSSTNSLSGRLKPWVRAEPATYPLAPIMVEGIWIGDSIVAPFGSDGPGIGSYLYHGGNVGEWNSRPGQGNIARPLYTISGQQSWWLNPINKWRGLSSIKWIVVQVGINDVLANATSAQMILDYQALLNQLRSDNPTAKIITGELLPAGAFGGGWSAPQHAAWTALNQAIDGLGGTPITGADATVHDGFVPSPFNNGSDDLAAAYNVGDGLHTNDAGRALQAANYRAAIVSLGLLPP